MTPSGNEAESLLELAERDYKAFMILVDDPEAHVSSALFHAQQYAEKTMKAVLVERGVVFRRTHNLVELEDLLEAADVNPFSDKDSLQKLNPYAIDVRYVIGGKEMTKEEAKAVVAAIRIWAGSVLER
ncbi:MAG: HEPN domain-containing protein [Nitrospinae bacterium]|nr:HEPN domain-containing protein [Nitrospinota bacterium]